MEDLIGILFAVGFIIFNVWNGTKKEQKEAVPTTIPHTDNEEEPYNPEEVEWMDETSPTMHPTQTEEQSQKVYSLNDLLTSLQQTPRTEKPKLATTKTSQTTKSVTPQPMTKKRPSKSIGQHLHSSQEIRRAFIYSEIFKRKYE